MLFPFHRLAARPLGRQAGFALFSVVLILIAACSSGGDNASTAAGDGAGPHFLLTTSRGLSELNGQDEKLLIQYADGSYIADPSISPDGKRLAYSLQPPARVGAGGGVDFGADIYVAKRDGKDPQLVLAHTRVGEFLRNPVWLDNNQLLINIRGRSADGLPDLRIESIDLRSGAQKRILSDSVELALSPDGKDIAHVYIDPQAAGEHLAFADLQTGARHQLLAPNSPLILITALVWSPNGSRLAFGAADPSTIVRQGDNDTRLVAASVALHPTLQDIWVVNRDGTGLQRLADIAESQPSIAWTPDGSGLYVLGTAAFLKIDIQTGQREQIGPGIPYGQILRIGD